MRNYNLQVKCARCAAAEVITANDYELKIHEVMNVAYQADVSRINPYFKLPNKVLSGSKGEPNWVHVALCDACRDEWSDTALPDLSQTLNDFLTGSNP